MSQSGSIKALVWANGINVVSDRRCRWVLVCVDPDTHQTPTPRSREGMKVRWGSPR